MKFKPTLLKSIISLISGIFTNYLFAGTIKVSCVNSGLGSAYFCPQPHWIDFAFDTFPIIISLVSLIIVYIIWSLFQKKK
jgi:hypothetical protein